MDMVGTTTVTIYFTKAIASEAVPCKHFAITEYAVAKMVMKRDSVHVIKTLNKFMTVIEGRNSMPDLCLTTTRSNHVF